MNRRKFPKDRTIYLRKQKTGDFLKEQNQALFKDLHLDGGAPKMSA